jgi:IS4 transposase
VLTGFYSQQHFEAPIRRIRFKDPDTGKTLVFLTNNFALTAVTITDLYRCRWQVELFLCVQRRLAHPAGGKPAGVKVKPP